MKDQHHFFFFTFTAEATRGSRGLCFTFGWMQGGKCCPLLERKQNSDHCHSLYLHDVRGRKVSGGVPNNNGGSDWENNF